MEERKYDEKYDGKRGFSDIEALKIEEASRQVADRLGAVYAEEAEEEVKKETAAAQKSADTCPKEEILAMLHGGYAALSALARQRGVLVETLVEKINAYATELYGDILLEATEDGYAIIEDYIEELPKWEEE